MKLLALMFILMSPVYAANDELLGPNCEIDIPDQITPIVKILNYNFFNFSSQYYLYYQAKSLGELQVLKNCLDYTACGKSKESIVEDPENYRVHIWADLTIQEIASIVRSCPIKDLNKKLMVKEVDRKGKQVAIGGYTPSASEQSVLVKKASPALFYEPSDKTVQATMKTLRKLLKASKLKQAESLVLNTWGLDLHQYELKFGGVADHIAVTINDDKKILYGKAWLADPCSYVRMIRHEAEHIAQYKRAIACDFDHIYGDHQMRERAAYINDLRFIKTYCPGAASMKLTCIEKLRNEYLNFPKKTLVPGK